MASNVPPGAPRQSPPPNYNPNYQQNPNILSDNFQNLNLNRPPSMASSAPRPSPFSQPSPFPSSVPSPQFSRPGALPIGAVPRPSVPPSGSPSTFSSNVAPGRPTGPPFSQPPPFGSRPPPGSFQSYTSGGMVAGPVSGAQPVGARPSPAASSSSPPQNVPPSSSFGGLVSNGPPAPAFQSAPRFPPPVSAPQQQPMGPPPTMGVARSPPQSMRPLMGSSGFSGQPVAPFSAPPQGTPFYAPPQGTPFSAPPQGTPFYAPPQGTPFSAQQGMTPPPIGSPFAPQMQPQSMMKSEAGYQVETMELSRFAAALVCLTIKDSFNVFQLYKYMDVEIEDSKKIEVAQPPPRMFGMPPLLPNQMTAISPVIGQTGSPLSGASKIDPNQIPRPIPGSSVILHDTRAGNQANPPPPATSDYIVTDTGNCSPRYMRCTINQIPCTVDLLSTSGMQLALLVQPLALPHPSEEAVQVVDFGESGPVRCSRCKGYINPFMKFIDQGRRFICNLCGFTDETPRDYLCNLGPDGRRRDADERPELCRGTVEFVATKEFMVRDPMPAVYFFLIDVSMHAMQTGATAAACSSISQVIADLPEGPRTMVGIATFDSTIHFYNMKRALQQPLMLIVPDIHDVYTPLQTDVIVPLSECRQHLELLLESIPTMFQNSRIAESSFSAAIKVKLTFSLSMILYPSILPIQLDGSTCSILGNEKYWREAFVLPSVGVGALSAREAEGRSNISTGEKIGRSINILPNFLFWDCVIGNEVLGYDMFFSSVHLFLTCFSTEAHKLLQPADKTLKEMAIEFAEYQVCVDVFITTQTYVDIASISVIPKTTGGQVYYYYPFSAVSDPAKLYNDLRWNVTRPQGFEAVMRVRCSQGIQIQEYHGNFCKRIPTDIDLAVIDCDKTIMVTLKHDDKLQDGTECAFQALESAADETSSSLMVHSLAMDPIGTTSCLFLPSVGVGALSAREAEGRSNISTGEKVYVTYPCVPLPSVVLVLEEVSTFYPISYSGTVVIGNEVLGYDMFFSSVHLFLTCFSTEAHKLLQPADKTLKEMAIEFAEYQVCVDVFITTQTYVDIASISVIPKTTGGQVYYYYPFSAVSDPAKLYNDLRWNVTRPQGLRRAVMRVRAFKFKNTMETFASAFQDIDLAVIDCDKTIMVTLKHDDKLQDGQNVLFRTSKQTKITVTGNLCATAILVLCALLYTTVYGQRRIRVANLSLPCTNNLSNLFRLADLDSQFVCFLKQAANEIPSNPSLVVQEQVTNFCINILLSYRKFCATVSSSGQLILPEALKLLPLYTLGICFLHIDLCLFIGSVYVEIAVIYHDRFEMNEADGSRIPSALALSSEYVSEDGIYLLENGQDGLIYIGNSVTSDTLQKLFGISSVAEIPTQYSQFVLEQYDNPLSKKLNNVVNEIRQQRCSFLRLKLCKKGDPSGMSFFSYLVEDKVPAGGLSYVEFLVHIHRQIQPEALSYAQETSESLESGKPVAPSVMSCQYLIDKSNFVSILKACFPRYHVPWLYHS
ncbi:hypothetical protein POTOM_020608 [Populus tomentosa]|uniref:Sec23/sec24 transport family protein n=1 Tax=Populus tomentosa TaxID=118781 RepID=A0A8X7ZLX5_POPTO|nr:hypothetical protein POTOM_020608 [Populus tomentosa]